MVRDDARKLQQNVGGADRRKLDEYLTAIRELEVRIDKAAQTPDDQTLAAKRPQGIPASLRGTSADHGRPSGARVPDRYDSRFDFRVRQ